MLIILKKNDYRTYDNKKKKIKNIKIKINESIDPNYKLIILFNNNDMRNINNNENDINTLMYINKDIFNLINYMDFI